MSLLKNKASRVSARVPASAHPKQRMPPTVPLTGVKQAVMGLSLARTPVIEFRGIHQHNEIEISVTEGGELSTLFGDRRAVRHPNQLAICWGAVPHGAIRVSRGNPIAYSLHIPLALFNSWELPEALVTRVLHGERIVAQPQTQPCSDLALVKHWHRLMAGNDPASREIVLHEVQARLRRLALKLPDAPASRAIVSRTHSTRVAGLFEKMLAEIHKLHTTPLTVRQIAQAAGIGPDHAMHLFREACGITIHEHLTRCRIFTAQRLLATTEEKVTAIGQTSGFRSPDCFHRAFKQICDCTPRRYREQIRGTV